MATNNEILGKIGEDLAEAFLQESGMKVIGRNVRIGRAEIDLIVLDGPQLVFVEVKTRRRSVSGYPEASVGKRKEDTLLEASHQYCLEHEITGGVRIDIIAILIENARPQIEHLKDAIWPLANLD